MIFPGLSQHYLAWIALAPLLWAILSSRSVLAAAGSGLLAGTVQWLLLLAWIPRVMMYYGGLPPVAAWALLALLSLYLGLYHAAACLCTRYCMNRGGPAYLLLFPFCWIGTECLRSYFLTGGFPWLLLGYSQTESPRLIQIADVTGVFGLSFFIAWVNTAAVWLWIYRRRLLLALCPTAGAVSMLLGLLLYGENALSRWERVNAPHTVVMLQGDLAPEESFAQLAWKSQEGYVAMLKEMGGAPVDLLLLPEAPAARSFQYDAEHRAAMQQLARGTRVGLVLNNVHREEAGESERYYNSAYFLAPDGGLLGRYDKIHLVPFGEYVPWSSLFFFLDTVTRDVGSFSPGSNYEVANMGGHPLNAVICFEAVFPQLSRRFVRKGSTLMVNLTNDRWYGDSAAPYQHLLMARWRAVENRRFFLRATNSGISAIITPTGKIQASSGLLREEVCSGRFGWIRETTVYSRHGEAFAVLCAIITVLGAVIATWGPIPTRGSGAPNRGVERHDRRVAGEG